MLRRTAGSVQGMTISEYDDFAPEYDAANAANLLNNYYERPAMLDLVGDVQGRRFLDAGCGSGPLSVLLRERGAIVTGFDSSARMIAIARKRLLPYADLRVLDLGEALPYEDGSFDDVVASLVLHYLRDWGEALSELRRVLRPGGRLILSVNHPLVFPMSVEGAKYFPIAEFPMECDFGGTQATLQTWHRPLHAMVDAFHEAGFRIADIAEPPVAPDTPSELLPNGSTRFVSFIFFVLQPEQR